jgi:predicted HicB family RNase H-like nuclease
MAEHHRPSDNLARLHVRIDPALMRQLKIHAIENGISLQDFVTEALRRQLDEQKARTA